MIIILGMLYVGQIPDVVDGYIRAEWRAGGPGNYDGHAVGFHLLQFHTPKLPHAARVTQPHTQNARLVRQDDRNANTGYSKVYLLY